MKKKIIISRWVEFFYTLPIWIVAIPYVLTRTIFAIYKFHKENGKSSDLSPLQERSRLIIIGFSNKRFFNIFLSTIVWFCLYKISLK